MKSCIGWLEIVVVSILSVSFAVSAETPSPDSPPTEAEFEECRAWYERANFERVDQLPFVRVWTGWSYTSGGKKFNPTMVGFLKDDSLGEEGQSFEVFAIDRNVAIFERNPDGAVDDDRVDYEVIEFDDWIEAYLDKEISTARFGDDEEDVDRLTIGGFFRATPSTRSITCLHLAIEAERRGLQEASRKLFLRVPKFLRNRNSDEVEVSLARQIENELGHVLMWQAVVDCDDPSHSRPQLLEQFRRVVRVAPESRHGPSANQFAERLEKMIEEDAKHAEARKVMPFDQLSKDEQIKDLVFQLRDQDGAQWSQPGSCSIFTLGKEGDSPADQLVEIGFPAVPHLIDALVDQSLTYSVGYHRNFYFSHRVLTVGDAAEQVIEKITGARLPAPPNIRVFGNDPDQDEKERVRAAQQEAALKWWLDFEELGERGFLIREVGNGGPAGSNLATRLIELYPEDALKPVMQGLDKSSDSWSHYRYAWAIGSSEYPGRFDILRKVINEGRFAQSTMAALEAIQEEFPKEGVERACQLLDLDRTWESEDDFGDTLAEDLFEFIIYQGSEVGLRKISLFVDRLTVSYRVDLALGLFGCEWTSDEGGKAVEKMLAQLVEDSRRRTGMSGSVGEFSYSDPRVCDLAGEALHKHWPDRYQFDFEGPTKTKNQQCLKMANTWRKSAGEPLLESDERVVEPMSQEEFAKLVTDESSEDGLFAQLEKQGVRVVPHLLDDASPLSNDQRKQAVSLAMRLGNRVERIRILPEGSDYAPVTRWAGEQTGKQLDGASVVKLISTFFKKADADGQAFRGLEFEALRHNDLTGIDVTLRLKPRERLNDPLDQWNGDEEVTVGKKSIHTAGYGGGLSKDDPKESADLSEAVDEAVAASLDQSIEIRWKLIGWWHDDEE